MRSQWKLMDELISFKNASHKIIRQVREKREKNIIIIYQTVHFTFTFINGDFTQL